jgi:3-dehydroquinate dehydratase-2
LRAIASAPRSPSAAAKAVMCGFGVLGYGLAIDGLAQLLAQQQPAA